MPAVPISRAALQLVLLLPDLDNSQVESAAEPAAALQGRGTQAGVAARRQLYSAGSRKPSPQQQRKVGHRAGREGLPAVQLKRCRSTGDSKRLR